MKTLKGEIGWAHRGHTALSLSLPLNCLNPSPRKCLDKLTISKSSVMLSIISLAVVNISSVQLVLVNLLKREGERERESEVR